MRRAVLIVNPLSSSVTPESIEAVETVLRRRVQLVTRRTDAPGHASELAAEAVREAEAVLVFSGDGTYNEAINGAAGSVPFGFLPGGGTSVLPRALGLPRDPAAAAERVAAAIEEGRTRSIGLGRVNGRRFLFSAGIGIDAELVRRVERQSPGGHGNRTYVATLVRLLAELRLRIPDQLEIVGHGRAAFVFVANGRPYTYAGPVPIAINKATSFEEGLDFVAPRELTPSRAPRFVWQAFRGTVAKNRAVLSGHDLERIEVRCDQPLALQADGEDLGDVTEAVFEAERDALAVLV
jgi:diacylglycerol kinase family enzyme